MLSRRLFPRAVRRSNSVLVYSGPSLYTGAPIYLVLSGLTTKSSNPKTGNMVQSWILDAQENPVQAVHNGADVNVCGNCGLRGSVNRERRCYVNVAFAPNAIWKAVKRNRVPAVTVDEACALLAGRQLRIGSYGDPAAVPAAIWQSFTMTSVESECDARSAWARGERTFRVVQFVSDLVAGREIVCPASAEAGHRTTCENCGLCCGKSDARSIAIVDHGPVARAAARRRAA